MPMASEFEAKLCSLLNRYSQENASNTPDFILARYLFNCLDNWNQTCRYRETWYGWEMRPAADGPRKIGAEVGSTPLLEPPPPYDPDDPRTNGEADMPSEPE